MLWPISDSLKKTRAHEGPKTPLYLENYFRVFLGENGEFSQISRFFLEFNQFQILSAFVYLLEQTGRF